jgi:hypothetical protein
MPANKRPLLLIVALVVALGVGAAIYLFGNEDERHTIEGSVLLLGKVNIEETGESCRGLLDWDDLYEGAPVTLRDDQDRVLATGTLSAGSPNTSACTFKFTLTDVPEVSNYRLHINEQEPIELTREFFTGSNWVVEVVWGGLD